jgi:hypothetical protein
MPNSSSKGDEPVEEWIAVFSEYVVTSRNSSQSFLVVLI